MMCVVDVVIVLCVVGGVCFVCSVGCVMICVRFVLVGCVAWRV